MERLPPRNLFVSPPVTGSVTPSVTKSVTQHALMRERQAGRPRPANCELCDRPDGQLVFDHCHARGSFRGWICRRCNNALGLAGDNPALLRAMADYLEIERVPVRPIVAYDATGHFACPVCKRTHKRPLTDAERQRRSRQKRRSAHE